MALPNWAWNDTLRRILRHFFASLASLLTFWCISAILHRVVDGPPELLAYLSFLDRAVLVVVATCLAVELLYDVIMDLVSSLGRHVSVLA